MKPRRLLIALAAAACLFAITAKMLHAGMGSRNNGPAQTQYVPVPGPDTITFPYSLSVPKFRWAAFSPDDSVYAVVGDPAAGDITLRHLKKGLPIWKEHIPDANTVTVGRSGDTVIAYAAMDPTRQAVTIIRGIHKDAVYRYVLDGAIWDVDISGNGAVAAMVTGGHSLYIFDLIGMSKPLRVPLMGTGTSVAVNQTGSLIAVGTWDSSGVECYNGHGEILWHFADTDNNGSPVTNRLFRTQIARDGPYVLGVSFANVRNSNAKIYLWRKSGQPVWTYALSANDSDPQMKVASSGSRVALSFLHTMQHADKSVEHRELMVIDRYGHPVWPTPKGGLLMSPNLLAISPDGNTVTVTDFQRTLYNFDADGRISTHSKSLPRLISPPIINSDDGEYILISTQDGNLTLVKPV